MWKNVIVQVSLPVTYAKLRELTQPSVLNVRHNMIMLGVTTVERPDPKALYTLINASYFRYTGDSYLCSPDLELGALTKWIASRMLV